ncbi:MarR family transcriptional regulator [Propioniciclava sp. MC1595]|jgi:DNA-binding MarR family transcriptional regulator|uniref:MarR family transcriptional regulator n=1 Tax=Propioniciclava sp. MC1595 TaxID=2760308 RepID=UPI0016625369|nr:MarR family transcriptional regulator [Propioniciclava sp. MC1595]MBB1496357.1 MarR family transcriptional regulator [Propioniciclava sp. MC1595]QTE26149.1 MarR family transcriptional regulator [Propioniciclava sp. MC1595]
MSHAYHPATFALQAVIAQSNVLERELARLLGLNATDYRALSALQQLSRQETVTMTGLGAALGTTAATTSAIVDRLQRAGYAQRNRAETDRRLVTIEPTPLAWQKIVEIMRPLMGATDAWVKALRPEDAQLVTEFLQVTATHLTDHAATLAAQEADR